VHFLESPFNERRNRAITQALDDGSLHALFEGRAKMGMDALSEEQASLLRGKAFPRVLLLARNHTILT
jgi:hypothetical protein